jgi:hypothetical protein
MAWSGSAAYGWHGCCTSVLYGLRPTYTLQVGSGWLAAVVLVLVVALATFADPYGQPLCCLHPFRLDF